jgi:hypothetical protein
MNTDTELISRDNRTKRNRIEDSGNAAQQNPQSRERVRAPC